MNRRQMLGAASTMLALGPQIAMEAVAQVKVQAGGPPVLLPPRLKAAAAVSEPVKGSGIGSAALSHFTDRIVCVSP